MTTPAATLRGLLSTPELILVPGAFDALSARIVEEAGFACVYLTGAGFANASFAFPDIGLIGLSEVAEHTRRMREAVSIPLIVDADTGFGDLIQVRRTVRELERAGAAAIQLEDQVAPKRCGHFDGQRVIHVDEMVRKISIALDSRQDSDVVIIARTDSRSAEGFESAVERARAYAAAGADLIFVEAVQTLDELTALPKLIDAPLLLNMVEGGKTPAVTAAALRDAGYKVALYANTALRASMYAVRSAMTALRRDGDTSAIADAIVSWQERQDLVRLSAFQAMEEHYTLPSSGGVPAPRGA